MTNGEKMKQAFPDLQIDMGELEVYMWTTAHDAIDISLEWWNAEYKESNCSEIPTGSITKNCRTCRNFGTHHGICEICKDNKCWTEKEPTKNDLGVDCISRADVNQVIEDYMDEQYGALSDKTRERAFGAKVAKALINELPSVTPQPKHGIWQQINKNEVNVIPEYRCSNCGAEFKGFGFDFDYCPRCGCAMEEEE